MLILGIETSCDETALGLLEAEGQLVEPTFSIVGEKISSQVEIHAPWGGVVPSLAKREHNKNLLPLLDELIKETKNLEKEIVVLSKEEKEEIKDILSREEKTAEILIDWLEKNPKPKIDLIAVTVGPGLEPALWAGINFAKALTIAWQIPIVGANHLVGHLFSPWLAGHNPPFPFLGLIISGGHTELAIIRSFTSYQIIGSTRDDAVGEAFDKVARLLGLPYPGGPAISELAKKNKAKEEIFNLPRPMIHTQDFDFSFSGLKTAVLYIIKKKEDLDQEERATMAYEFEKVVGDILAKKTIKALEEYNLKTLVVGGGVSANSALREILKNKLTTHDPEIKIYFPEAKYSTDNALMIAQAGYFQYLKDGGSEVEKLSADGNLSLE